MLGKQRVLPLRRSFRQNDSPPTMFPQVVLGLQLTSYVLLVILSIGPLLALEWNILLPSLRYKSDIPVIGDLAPNLHDAVQDIIPTAVDASIFHQDAVKVSDRAESLQITSSSVSDAKSEANLAISAASATTFVAHESQNEIPVKQRKAVNTSNNLATKRPSVSLLQRSFNNHTRQASPTSKPTKLLSKTYPTQRPTTVSDAKSDAKSEANLAISAASATTSVAHKSQNEIPVKQRKAVNTSNNLATKRPSVSLLQRSFNNHTRQASPTSKPTKLLGKTYPTQRPTNEIELPLDVSISGIARSNEPSHLSFSPGLENPEVSKVSQSLDQPKIQPYSRQRIPSLSQAMQVSSSLSLPMTSIAVSGTKSELTTSSPARPSAAGGLSLPTGNRSYSTTSTSSTRSSVYSSPTLSTSKAKSGEDSINATAVNSGAIEAETTQTPTASIVTVLERVVEGNKKVATENLPSILHESTVAPSSVEQDLSALSYDHQVNNIHSSAMIVEQGAGAEHRHEHGYAHEDDEENVDDKSIGNDEYYTPVEKVEENKDRSIEGKLPRSDLVSIELSMKVSPYALENSHTTWVQSSELSGHSKHTEDEKLSLADGFGVSKETSEQPWFDREKPSSFIMQEAETRTAISKLASEALNQIHNEGFPCLPKVCTEGHSFYDISEDISKLFLVSFPGSGNTWLRRIVRAGTRHYTGSVYSDKKLAMYQGFLGELLPAADKQTSVVKSHYPMWNSGAPAKMPLFESAIFIIRSPFDAILAELHRILSRDSHKGATSIEQLQAINPNQIVDLAQWFSDTVHFWEGLNGFDVRKGKIHEFPGNGMREYNSTRVRNMTGLFSFDVRPIRDDAGFPVLTMFYEDFVRDLVPSMAHLFAYLKIKQGDAMPSVYEAMACTLNKQNTFLQTKRMNFTGNPFSQNIIENLCSIFAPSWNEAKWGPCVGELQRERDNVNVKDLPETRFDLVCQASEKDN